MCKLNQIATDALLEIPGNRLFPSLFPVHLAGNQQPAVKCQVEVVVVAPEFDRLLEFECPVFQFMGQLVAPGHRRIRRIPIIGAMLDRFLKTLDTPGALHRT